MAVLLPYTCASALLASIAPLTASQQARLETAHDGRDHREEAFVALVENVRQWTGGVEDAPIRLEVDLEEMVSRPEAFRGDLCRLTGVLVQQTPLARPHEEAAEWFLRDGDGRPLIVYVVGPTTGPAGDVRDGQRVSIDARFYKRVDFTARDGVRRSYAAFVGTAPRRLAGGGVMGPQWVIIAPVAVLLIVFVALLIYTRDQRRRRQPPRRRLVVDEPLDDGGPLPDDPSEALAELKRRATR